MMRRIRRNKSREEQKKRRRNKEKEKRNRKKEENEYLHTTRAKRIGPATTKSSKQCEKDSTDSYLRFEANILLADKAYDAAERVIDVLQNAGKKSVIPSKSSRLEPREYDRELYKSRHLIENFFCKLKQFRAIATRYDKTARNFLAAIYLTSAIIWLN